MQLKRLRKSLKVQQKKLNISSENNSDAGMLNKYALVLVNIRGLGVKTFSYLIPEEMKTEIKIGQAILVPFGRQGLINAFVVGFSNYLPENIRKKKINKILDETSLFSVEYLKLLEWVSNYYCCDFITVLNMAIPVKLIDKNAKIEKSIEFVKFDGATKRQTEILKKLKETGKFSLTEFQKEVKTTRTTVNKLLELGCVKISDEEIYRNPLEIFNLGKKEALFELSAEQEKVYEEISKKINLAKEKSNEPTSKLPILLHGVTASGKTEVYFKLIKDTIDSRKNVLFLVPEIALASQLTKRLAKKFGTRDVAIWHSSISDGERYDVWQRLYKDDIKILAGARSAVFAPLKNIGVIVIDEEHTSTYKQDNNPKYNAIDIAIERSKYHNAVVILGSATPSLETYSKSLKGIYELLELNKRVNNKELPKVELVDLNIEKKKTNIFSQTLIDSINEKLFKNEQIILLLNRRGYSSFVACSNCGHVEKCPNCDITLTYHKTSNVLRCHYCGYATKKTDICTECHEKSMKDLGIGTEKVEEELN